LASGREEDFAEELNSVKNENKKSPEILVVWSLALLGGSEKATLDGGRNSGGGQKQKNSQRGGGEAGKVQVARESLASLRRSCQRVDSKLDIDFKLEMTKQ